jgi:hypothetical protein
LFGWKCRFFAPAGGEDGGNGDGFDPFAVSADFGKLIADETEKWGKVIRSANIKPE